MINYNIQEVSSECSDKVNEFLLQLEENNIEASGAHCGGHKPQHQENS